MLGNSSNGFVVISKLEHMKCLILVTQCKNNFFIWVNQVKDIIGRTRLPRIVNYTNALNSKLPTLRGSKPSQIDSKWAENYNTCSLIYILNIPNVAGHETFLGKRYSKTNWATVCILTLAQNGTSPNDLGWKNNIVDHMHMSNKRC